MGLMNAAERLQRVRQAVVASRSLFDAGITPRELRRLLHNGQRVSLGTGFSVSASTWRTWYGEEQHLARALATVYRSRRHTPVFSHHTAALIHGLPGFHVAKEPVHLTEEPGHVHGRRGDLMRHSSPLPSHEVMSIAGLRCTTLERTLCDMARFATPEQAIVTLDAGLLALGGSGAPVQDVEAHRAALRKRLLTAGGKGGRGRRRGLRMLTLADARADSPAESLSRLQLVRLGFEVASQVEVPGPSGSYFIDFELVGLGVFGEVDGDVKYRDDEMLRGRTSWEVVREEKRREDWIRGVTGNRVVRWGFREAASRTMMRDRLQRFAVVPAGGWRELP